MVTIRRVLGGNMQFRNSTQFERIEVSIKKLYCSIMYFINSFKLLDYVFEIIQLKYFKF